jgi:hypothetical protein
MLKPHQLPKNEYEYGIISQMIKDPGLFLEASNTPSNDRTQLQRDYIRLAAKIPDLVAAFKKETAYGA